MTKKCCICGNDKVNVLMGASSRDEQRYECPDCGVYYVNFYVARQISYDQDFRLYAPALAWERKMQGRDNYHLTCRNTTGKIYVGDILFTSNFPKTYPEKLDRVLLHKHADIVIVKGKSDVDMESFVERVENFYEKRLNTLLAVFSAIISVVGIALPIVSMFLQDSNYKDNMDIILDMMERAKNNETDIKTLLNKSKLYFPLALNAGKKAQKAYDNADAAIKSLQNSAEKYEKQFQQMYLDWNAQYAANYNGLARTFMEIYKRDNEDIHVKNAIIYLLMAIKFNISISS